MLELVDQSVVHSQRPARGVVPHALIVRAGRRAERLGRLLPSRPRSRAWTDL